MDMVLPSRPPRNEPSLEKYNYYDHETALQPDGRIAAFEFEAHKRKDGWKFVGYQDVNRFHIWTEKDRARMWDDKITIEQLLLESKGEVLSPFEAMKEGIAPEEACYHYVYGGVLSQRGGLFVVKRDQPDKIIRAKMTWLS